MQPDASAFSDRLAQGLAKLRRSKGSPFSLVFSDAIVSGHHHPNPLVPAKQLDPFDIGGIPTAGEVGDMMSAVAEMLHKSINCRSQHGRSAIVEKDFHAACARTL